MIEASYNQISKEVEELEKEKKACLESMTEDHQNDIDFVNNLMK